MATQRKTGLGKGLEALIRDTSVAVPVIPKGESKEEVSDGNAIKYVKIDNIKPNAMQPRVKFDEESISGLADSIEKHGVLQPVMLRKAKRGYELVAGERRWRAAKKSGLKEIPSIIREISDEENALFAIIENMQREDLNPMEEAVAYKKVIDAYGMTQEQVAKNVGKSRSYITNTLRLLALPSVIRVMIEEGDLTLGHANAIGAIKDEKKKIEIAKQIYREGLSVREAEALASFVAGKTEKVVRKKKKIQKSEDVRRIEDELTSLFGTKVTLSFNGNAGQIQLHFYSKDELDGLIDEIRNKAGK